MLKKSLSKIILDADLRESGYNFAVFYGLGIAATVASNLLFDFNLNVYHSVEHLAIGVGGGTFAYKKAGGGIRGVMTGLAAATLYNFGWELLEPSIPRYNGESILDTTSDIVSVYAGSISSFFLEKFKSGLENSNQPTAQK
ncbi:MAG: hypothetical protein AABY03_02460 [Nanoarchaeota archaeon]